MTGGGARGPRATGPLAWSAAHEGLLATARSRPLDAEQLERLAVAAFFLGRDQESADAWEQAYRAWRRSGDADRAGRCAFWLGLGLLLRGEAARANGWFSRGNRVVAPVADGCPAQGYLMVPAAMAAIARGDAAGADALYERAVAIADRFGDPDLLAIGLLGRGEAAIERGDVPAGMALLDEVMVSATSGEVAPLTTGILYCAVIDACVQVFDLRRAAEWTDALARWCDGQADLVPFRGQCLVHRSQVLQAHGEWGEALSQASTAEQRLLETSGPAVGLACYLQGELHRLRGAFDAAERAYRQASEHGRDPLPGFALLRLAQGRVEAAAVAIRRALDEAHTPLRRLATLPAYVEVMLAAGDPGAARAAVDELVAVVGDDAPLLAALASHATGSVLLAEGDPPGALVALRRACTTWRELRMPYECARSQELIGLACRALGDREGGELELDAARAVFRRLGAAGDAARAAAHGGAGGPPGAGLTRRECEVLRLVAAGMTNREIGAQLVISEHTAARHVQNIFTKIGVSSRAAATAFAYEHQIV